LYLTIFRSISASCTLNLEKSVESQNFLWNQWISENLCNSCSIRVRGALNCLTVSIFAGTHQPEAGAMISQRFFQTLSNRFLQFPMTIPTHGLSFDVECYYQILARDYLDKTIQPQDEVVRNTDYLLETLEQHDVKGTFFTLGNIAEHFPQLMRRIAESGHEIGVHGYSHRYINRMTKSSFAEELKRGIGALEEASGIKVTGHRAPAFSISRDSMWATDVMLELGLKYDSSIFPISGSRYGISDAPFVPHRLDNGLIEIPPTALRRIGKNLPAAGGGYFRLFPYQYTRWAFHACEKENRAAITYFHPYEFELQNADTAGYTHGTQWRMKLKVAKINRIQNTGRGKAMRMKFEKMLQDFRFQPINDIASQLADLSKESNKS